MSSTAGIDLGSDGIRGIVLAKAGSGPCEVVAAGTVPVGDLGRMPDSPDKTLALSEKLKDLVRSARLKAGTRRIAASGNAVSIRYLQVPPVPPWRMDMLVKYEVDEKVGDKEACAYDHRILDVPEVNGQYTVLIGVCKEGAAHALLEAGKSSGLGEVEIDLEAVALFNAYYHGHGFDSDKSVLIVDIGTEKINVLLCRNGALYLARTALGGGQRFTQVLAEELKIEPAEAEEIKRTQAEIIFDLAPAASTRGGTLRLQRGGTTMLRNPNLNPARPGNPGASAGLPSVPPAGTDPLSAPTTLDLPKDLVVPPEPSKGEGAPAVSLELPPSLEIPDAPVGTDAPSVMGGAGSGFAAGGASSSFPSLPSLPTIEHAQHEPGADEKRKKQMSAALVREAAAICAALENTVLQCKQQAKIRDLKIDRIYLTGGGSKLKGLQEFMSRRMRMEVLPLEPFKLLSLDRLPADQAAELKTEQHNLSVAVGLAVSNLQPGAFSFLLWPESVRKIKTYWARGAYLHYSAALLALAIGLFIITPWRNKTALAANEKAAEEATKAGTKESLALRALLEENKEKELRRKKIGSNITSGQYFLTLLAELKNKKRISDDIYLTQISTKVPNVYKKIAGSEGGTAATPNPKDQNADKNAVAEDTFQVERRVFVRGFARASDKVMLIKTVQAFIDRLVPHPDDPDHTENLFKDVRPLWFSPEDQRQGAFYLQEFIVEAYVEGTRDTGKTEEEKPKAGTRTIKTATPNPDVKTAPQVQPTQPAQPQPNPVTPAQPKKKFTQPTVQPAPNTPQVPPAQNPNPQDPKKQDF